MTNLDSSHRDFVCHNRMSIRDCWDRVYRCKHSWKETQTVYGVHFCRRQSRTFIQYFHVDEHCASLPVQGNVFTRVCHPVYRGRGRYDVTSCYGQHQPGQHPLESTTLEQHHPCPPSPAVPPPNSTNPPPDSGAPPYN